MNIDESFALDILHVLAKHGIIPDIYLRNEEIISEYKELRASGTKGKVARERLSEKYCTSVKNVESILYRKRSGKE